MKIDPETEISKIIDETNRDNGDIVLFHGRNEIGHV